MNSKEKSIIVGLIFIAYYLGQNSVSNSKNQESVSNSKNQESVSNFICQESVPNFSNHEEIKDIFITSFEEEDHFKNKYLSSFEEEDDFKNKYLSSFDEDSCFLNNDSYQDDKIKSLVITLQNKDLDKKIDNINYLKSLVNSLKNAESNHQFTYNEYDDSKKKLDDLDKKKEI